jgi:predicted metal-binding membrane protein
MTLQAVQPPPPAESDGGVEAILQRDRSIVAVGLGAVTVLAWAYMFYDAWRMSQDPACCSALASANMDHWPIGELGMMFTMWSVMMVAMMVPSAAPMVLLFAGLNRRRRQQDRPYVSAGLFLLGYLLIWTGFSAVVTPLQWMLHAAALLSPTMVSSSAYFGAAILIAAGVFQFTPLKNACLQHCRTPLQYFMMHWREGRLGALKMGLHHGIGCTGCCWLLMALLFVAGVMNLLWVATITIFVLLEKVAPAPRLISRIGGAALIAWGVVLAVRG